MNEEKSKDLDQFYTNPKIAASLYAQLGEILDINQVFFIEPSAGSGSFSNLLDLNNSLSLDIDPKQDYIKKQDYLLFDDSILPKNRTIVTIGNPPFGKNSSLALKFFNKSAIYSNYIAFILPKTFKKDSMVNKLDKNMFLIYEKELTKNSFIYNEEPYDVPCVFQVWEKRDMIRDKIKQLTTVKYFDFTTKDKADLAIRRVGGLAGKVLEDFEQYKKASHYFIKTNKKEITKELLVKLLKNKYNEFQSLAKNTAGNPSLSKHELITTII